MKVHEEEVNEEESEVNEQAETVITKESGVIFSGGKAILIEKKRLTKFLDEKNIYIQCW